MHLGSLTAAQIADFDAALEGAIQRAAPEIDRQISEALTKGWQLNELSAVLGGVEPVAVIPTFTMIGYVPDPAPLFEELEPGYIHVIRLCEACSIGKHRYGGGHG